MITDLPSDMRVAYPSVCKQSGWGRLGGASSACVNYSLILTVSATASPNTKTPG